MYVAAHIWQLQKIKGFLPAAATAVGGGAASGFTNPQHAVHDHPVTAAAQQPQAAAGSSSRINKQQQQQQQQGASGEFRLYVGPGGSAADVKSNNNSRRPATANASHGATEDLAAELLDTEGDTSSLVSSIDSEEEVHGGREELQYESDDEDEDKRVTAREKLGGAVFATHPHAKWMAGFRGKGAAEPQQQQQEQQQQGTVRLNKKLLEQHEKLQQQQQGRLEEQPLLGTEMPAEAAAAAGDSAGIQDAAAADDADAEQEEAAEAAGVAASTQQQRLLGNDAGMEAATGAGALSGHFAGCGAACVACASSVRLVVPLHSSAFNYRPTRSIMRRRRLMMQQVRRVVQLDDCCIKSDRI
jgi:hypothetical protein